jgi:hypothetical protein
MNIDRLIKQPPSIYIRGKQAYSACALPSLLSIVEIKRHPVPG